MTSAPSVRWTPQAHLHLTLKFLGEQPVGTADAVVAAIDSVASRHAPFRLDVSGLGAFPNRGRPRVVWAGVAAEPRVELLYHDVEIACAALGLPLEGRAFRPHVTLGRADRLATDELGALDAAARAARVAVASHISSVDLMRSELTARGARHERVAAAVLGGA